MTSEIKLSEILPPHFYEAHRFIKSHDYSEFVFPGGRGSCKSSFVSEEIPLIIKQNPQINALVLRKYGNTLKDSVFNQLLWAIDILGLSSEFRVTRSPLQIEYKPTGQTIFFRGLDDPTKVKSIKPKSGYIGVLWFEELDQFSGENEVRNVTQSVIRGGNSFYIFKSFNPPITAKSWANMYALEEKPDKIVIRSDYRTVPESWLGEKFLSDALFLKEKNERAYKHEYLGIPTGAGGNVFENVSVREITDNEINSFEYSYCGVDWGYFPDPFAFNRMTYFPETGTLMIYDEYHSNKESNRQTADKLMNDHGVTRNDLIICDAAESKSIGDYRSYGLMARPSPKPAVSYSMKWLQSLRAIIIDNKRCPFTAKEFLEYEYERTKDGEILNCFPDCNNHHIDAVRYAMSGVWRRKGE